MIISMKKNIERQRDKRDKEGVGMAEGRPPPKEVRGRQRPENVT